MNEYFFIWGLAFSWIIFAVVQDLKTREVSNWLNFSLIAFVLAYRGFYAVFSEDAWFFVYGILGVGLFIFLAYAFYYGRVFAGGDAKLLMGIGGVLPYDGLIDYVVYSAGFLFMLFASGAIWTLAFSLKIVRERRKLFVREFGKQFHRFKFLILIGIVLGFIMEFFGFYYGLNTRGSLLILFIVLPIVYIYTTSLEKGCMIVLKKPRELTEGDWLAKDIRLGKKWVRKSVHGLSKDEIKLLRKHGKKVLIKEGVPFTPAFLIAFVLFIVWLRYPLF